MNVSTVNELILNIIFYSRHIPQGGEVQVATNIIPDDKAARKLFFKKRSTSSTCAVTI